MHTPRNARVFSQLSRAGSNLSKRGLNVYPTSVVGMECQACSLLADVTRIFTRSSRPNISLADNQALAVSLSLERAKCGPVSAGTWQYP